MISALGWFGIGMLLGIMGLLSRRLGRVTRADDYYIGFFVGAGLILVSVVIRVVHGLGAPPQNLTDSVLWVLLYHGAPALGLTIGVVTAWRYWSWLLAERD
jgi:hypothetical protein